MHGESLAYGIIEPDVTELSPILDFIENAKKFGHPVTRLIICYKYKASNKIIKSLSEQCEIILLKRGNTLDLEIKLKEIGLSEIEIKYLIGTPYLKKFGLVAYGTSRNYILLAALLYNTDYLFFFDSDIYPKILTDCNKGCYHFAEIDFIGSHLKYLRSSDDIVATTSDYTGYYIIPRMNFPDLRKLLFGLQKEDRFYYITTVNVPVMREYSEFNIFNTMKLLGGNMALNLDKLDLIPPFFSSILTVKDQCYLGRGEDTLFGPIISSLGGKCVDIDLQIFHDCFHDFPKEPNIEIKKNIDRFFYACAGWLIRNPFFNWIRNEYKLSSERVNYQERLDALIIGSESAAKYFRDKRFGLLPEIFERAYEDLSNEINRFKDIMEIWQKLKRNLKERECK